MPLQFFNDVADETHESKFQASSFKFQAQKTGRAKDAKKNEAEEIFSFATFAAFARHLRARIDLIGFAS
jgi:hypothetical protein